MADKPYQNHPENEDESGQGGNNGQIEFRDFLNPNEQVSETVLTAEEIQHLIVQHKDASERAIADQKKLLENRKAVKEGRMSLETYRQGLSGNAGYGQNAGYKPNPLLEQNVRYHLDNHHLPTDAPAETNQAEQELKNQLRHSLQNAPRFNPRPLPR